MRQPETPSTSAPETAPAKKRRRFAVFRAREKPLPRWTIATSVLIYFPTALAVSTRDSGFLLMAWLLVGPLTVAVWYCRDIKAPVVNICTVGFLLMIVANLFGYMVTHQPPGASEAAGQPVTQD